MRPRESLPIDEVLPRILGALGDGATCVVTAAPGAGKTTRVAPALLKTTWADGRILLIEPRRVVARATARRIADELGGRVGDEVGYQVRFDNRTTPKTRLVVMTPGILLRWLTDDAFLDGVAAVLLDEFHERSVEIDLALGMLRRLQTTVRPELRLVLMSATLDAGRVAAYLDGCPVVHAPGRVFPVEVRHAPRPAEERIAQRPLAVLDEVWTRTPGDVLVFLPGAGEIRQAIAAATGWADAADAELLPLYGDLPPEAQDRVLQPGPRRRVVFSTNIAETSLTLPGVTAVIDTGVARQLSVCPSTGLNALTLEPISQASADQRTGRAGRTAPGVCWRLWSESAQRARPAETPPEIARVDLAPAVLQLHAWGEHELAAFPWFDPPTAYALAHAEQLLERLGALEGGRLTPLGGEMARLPAHPRLARLLLAAEGPKGLRSAALAAALLSERDLTPPGSPRFARKLGDLVDDLESGRLPPSTPGLGAVEQAARQFERLTPSRTSSGHSRPSSRGESLGRALLAAFPDRVCCRRQESPARAVMVSGRGVVCEASGAEPRGLFLAIDFEDSQSEARTRVWEPIERSWLPAARLTTRIDLHYDERLDRVQARQQVLYDDLILDESPAPLGDPEAAAEALAAAGRDHWVRAFPAQDEAVGNLIARCRFAAAHAPADSFPVIDEAWLKDLLPAVAWGLRSLADVQKGPWLSNITSRLTPAQRQLLDTLAPEKMTVPTGSQIRIDYAGERPALPVRIQEIFGWTATPRIAGGRVPLLLHLLAPNNRPQQITDDLTSFWKSAYPLIKGELQRRYPRHAWPSDPLNAPPQKKPAPRRP